MREAWVVWKINIFLSIMESFVTRMYPFKTRELCDRDETCIDFSCSSQIYCLLLHLLSMVKKKHDLIFLNGEGFEFTWKKKWVCWITLYCRKGNLWSDRILSLYKYTQNSCACIQVLNSELKCNYSNIQI